MDAATAREQACWQGLSECPRTCPTEHASLCKYARWFAPRPGPRLGSNPYVTLQLGLSRVLKIIKFRLGCHRLPIVALRNNNVPHAQFLTLLLQASSQSARTTAPCSECAGACAS